MDRRKFLQTGALAAAATAVDVEAEDKRSARRPNVLYVFSDQHRALSLPGEAFNQAMAPNIDEFRHKNFSMDMCVSNYPLCSPYRGIFMSGRWPCQNGIVQNGISLKTTEVSIGQTFATNGYHTGYVGKWHLGGGNKFIPKGPERFGFEDWHIWEDTNAHYNSWTYDQDTGQKIQPKGWNCTLMTDQAITFLQKQSKDKPWMLVVSWNPPHPPFNPPPEDSEPYKPEALKLRPNVKLLTGPEVVGARAPLTSEEKLRNAERGYYGGITGVDKEFARILKALDDTGQVDNTIIIYTSDHGEMMGSHGHMGKQMPHEESSRVPFFVRYPGITPKGGKSTVLFSAIDIYPTLCGLAGIPVPAHCGGRDLSAVMRGKKVTPPEAVFLMNEIGKTDTPEVNCPTYRGMRTQTHTYAVMATGRWCLFNNVADPYQLKNLVADPSQRPLMEKLDGMLLEWLKTTGDSFPFKDAAGKISNYPESLT